jgi:uncharacterized membrane protein (DUF485 family)
MGFLSDLKKRLGSVKEGFVDTWYGRKIYNGVTDLFERECNYIESHHPYVNAELLPTHGDEIADAAMGLWGYTEEKHVKLKIKGDYGKVEREFYTAELANKIGGWLYKHPSQYERFKRDLKYKIPVTEVLEKILPKKLHPASELERQIKELYRDLDELEDELEKKALSKKGKAILGILLLLIVSILLFSFSQNFGTTGLTILPIGMNYFLLLAVILVLVILGILFIFRARKVFLRASTISVSKN